MPAKQPSYQELQTKLDDVLLKLQADDVDVDEALKLYEDGLKLVEQLESRLAEAKNSVRELKTRRP